MITDHKTYIDRPDIHYRTAGDVGKQHLVFLHGWAARLDGPSLDQGLVVWTKV